MSHGHKALDPLAPRSALYQGPFGRLYPDLPPWSPPSATPGRPMTDAQADDVFRAAADTMVEAPGVGPQEIVDDPALRDELEARHSGPIPAGYTYFGQFVDHDITFDPASSLVRQNDPNGLLNFRTPRLDLDNVYGRGPAEQPYLYDATDRGKLLVGRVLGADGSPTDLRDLPRNPQGRALIGDMRNDENSIVSQLQCAFLLAHNTLLDRARDLTDDPDRAYAMAQRTLRWLYQWATWHDFLARCLDPDVHAHALRREQGYGSTCRWELGYDHVYRWKHQPYMPVEFSVAAYRFGHSMVRNAYRTNIRRGFATKDEVPIFSREREDPDDLRGFRPLPERNAVEWDWFLDMTSSSGDFPQRARRIDTTMANALSHLHEHDDPSSLHNVLAFRNLKRGWRFDLPSGTDLGNAMCLTPTALDGDEIDSLWYRCLKEAGDPAGPDGAHLGTMGSVVVGSVFAGLLASDPNGFVRQHPCWTPDDDPLLRAGEDDVDAAGQDNTWTVAAIVRLSGMPVAASDF